MSYFDRVKIRGVEIAHSTEKPSEKKVASERVYKDDDLVMDTLGTQSRLTAEEKRKQDQVAERHLRMRI